MSSGDGTIELDTLHIILIVIASIEAFFIVILVAYIMARVRNLPYEEEYYEDEMGDEEESEEGELDSEDDDEDEDEEDDDMDGDLVDMDDIEDMDDMDIEDMEDELGGEIEDIVDPSEELG